MNEARTEKIQNLIRQSQPNLTVILENVHDSHNIGAVMRTCDSIGIREIYVLYTHQDVELLRLGQRSSAGARKWVEVHLYTDAKKCFEVVKAKYTNIWATHLGKNAVSIYEKDLTQSVALLFGNEKDGVSEETLKYCNGNILIPQFGMVQSLNISVACAVTLYEALRQRQLKGYYSDNPLIPEEQQEQLFQKYRREHFLRLKHHFTEKKD